MTEQIISLNVGGKIFHTHIQTLTKYPDSLLGKMFNHTDHGLAPMHKTKDGYYFLEADPVYFEQILNYLRYDKIFTKDPEVLRGLESLANYFGLTDLLKELQSLNDSVVSKFGPRESKQSLELVS